MSWGVIHDARQHCSLWSSHDSLRDAYRAVAWHETGAEEARDGLARATDRYEEAERQFLAMDRGISLSGKSWYENKVGFSGEIRTRSTRAANFRQLRRVAEAEEQ